MKKLTQKDLYEYLDQYNFVSKDEIYLAINDFFTENFENFEPSYWDLLYYWQLQDEYMQDKDLVFENDD